MSSPEPSIQQSRTSAIYPGAATDLASLGTPRRVTNKYSGFSEKAPFTPGIEDSPSAIKHYPNAPETPIRRTPLNFDGPSTTYVRNVTRTRGSSSFALEDSPTAHKTPRMSGTQLLPAETTTSQQEAPLPPKGDHESDDDSDQESDHDDQSPLKDKGKSKEPPSTPPRKGDGGGSGGPGGPGGGKGPGGPPGGGLPKGDPPGGGPPSGGPGGSGPGGGPSGGDDVPDEEKDMFKQMLIDAVGSLQAIANKDGGGSGIKMKEPDTFDSSNPVKLCTFLVSLTLHFSARPKSFKEEASKIMFTLSYLRGTALQHFEQDILAPDLNNPPLWLTRYANFVKELQRNFGPHNEVENAEKKLVSLSIKFNLYTWGDDALKYQFYKGLPDRLKDQFALHGKPDELLVMKEKAADFDDRYWAREEEKKHDNRNRSHNTSSSTPKNDKR
jgi:hypothetical protein